MNGVFDHYSNFTQTLLTNLRHRFPDVNFIGIRIIPPREGSSFIKIHTSEQQYEKMMRVWKKEKTVSLNGTGYHKYFGISSVSLSNDSDFDVDKDATKTQIKNAFVKSLKSKKMNKKILGEFVELIA